MIALIAEALFVLARVILAYLESFVRLFVPPVKKDLRGEVVLVTGAGHGIGRCLAIQFAELGCKLVLWDINKEGNDATADQINNGGGDARSYLCDVTKVEDVKRAAERVRKDVGDVTILVNNAGVLKGLGLLRLSDDQIRQTMDVNCMAHFWTLREFLPAMMRKNHGHIVTTASLAAMGGCAYLVDYSASKFAVRGLTSALSEELARAGKTGVKTTTVYPSFVDTGLTWYVRLRFEKQLQPQEVAEIIIEGVQREYLEVFAPKRACISARLGNFMPAKARRLLQNFLDYNIDPQEGPKPVHKLD